jgi:hypothetical protein
VRTKSIRRLGCTRTDNVRTGLREDLVFSGPGYTRTADVCGLSSVRTGLYEDWVLQGAVMCGLGSEDWVIQGAVVCGLGYTKTGLYEDWAA